MLPSTLQFVMKDVLQTITGTERISFTPDQRRRPALAGKDLTPEEHRKYCELVKPATILAWFRELRARNYDSSAVRKRGRPRKGRDVRKLVIEMARANLGWATRRSGTPCGPA